MADNFKFEEAFNSQTLRGRANVAKATWASVGLIYMFVKLHRRSAKRREERLYCRSCLMKMHPKL
ncbi:putative 60S ribosomal protein L33 [Scaptodrosophila lebanonensis]|uniref:60S ribosomal protein L33 n=1 Tax=Drosophila lebanonensis TaxID=7225 RepID=A0A6J2U2A5_DROLE|nr:putative 60S ribosomal protein L33 [Scaptodrosophila lebanonensis]